MNTDALYHEICRNPEDDTLRLAYADYLEEQPTVYVQCLHCRAGDEVLRCRRCKQTVEDPHEHQYRLLDGGWFCDKSDVCVRCSGVGRIVDKVNADLAEFIRLQIALDTHPLGIGRNVQTGNYDATDGVSPAWGEAFEKFERSKELLAQHQEWRRISCPDCSGSGWCQYSTPNDEGRSYTEYRCTLCYGSGRLDRRLYHDASLGGDIEFRRGFPCSITCSLDNVVYRDGSASPWAKVVVTQTPITSFIPVSLPRFNHTNVLWLTWQVFGINLNMPPNVYRAYEEVIRQKKYDSAIGVTTSQLQQVVGEAFGRVVRQAVYGDQNQ